MDTSLPSATLFDVVRLGPLTLPNRIVMAPLTRSRAGAGDVPPALAATYYRQRASAGLIISEATPISQQGKGYAWTPGIWSAEQVAGWRGVTDAVREADGRIFLQLWHVGRVSHPSLQAGGALPVAPSAIQPKGQAFTETGLQPHPTPRALRTDEIPGIVADYVHAARNAREAGFDGVEIHGANGYLIDQFLRDGTNHRDDRYGGSVQNRLRFMIDIIEAVSEVWGADRVGIRLAPTSGANDISDSDPQTLFGAAVEAIDALGLVYLHLVEGQTGGARDSIPGFEYQALRSAFHGVYMANNAYTPALAAETIRSHRADLIAFGKPFISNPDLVERLRSGATLTPANPKTFYGGDERGYTDYPALAAGTN